MPTYEYLCASCKNAWEEVQRITEPALDTCPKCHQKTAHRQISAGNFILKGGGWYADLYSSSKGSPTKDEGSSGATASATGEAKSDTKPPPAKEAAPAAPAPTTTAASTGTTKE